MPRIKNWEKYYEDISVYRGKKIKSVGYINKNRGLRIDIIDAGDNKIWLTFERLDTKTFQWKRQGRKEFKYMNFAKDTAIIYMRKNP